MGRERKQELRALDNRGREGWNWRLLQNMQRGLTGELRKEAVALQRDLGFNVTSVCLCSAHAPPPSCLFLSHCL